MSSYSIPVPGGGETKPSSLVIGIVLVSFGIVAALIGISAGRFISGCVGDCAPVFSVGILFVSGGVIFLLIGIVVLATGRDRRISQMAPADAPQPGYVLCPHCAGQNYSAAVHCQWCGKPMKVET